MVSHQHVCVLLQGKRSLFLGAAGAGARMKLVVNMTMGSMMGEQQRERQPLHVAVHDKLHQQ
jgi:hypothetical protein